MIFNQAFKRMRSSFLSVSYKIYGRHTFLVYFCEAFLTERKDELNALTDVIKVDIDSNVFDLLARVRDLLFIHLDEAMKRCVTCFAPSEVGIYS